MIVYEVCDDGSGEGYHYFSNKAEALKFARDESAPYEDEYAGEVAEVCGSERRVERFDFHPTKSSIIALMNGRGWRPEAEVVAVFECGKRIA